MGMGMPGMMPHMGGPMGMRSSSGNTENTESSVTVSADDDMTKVLSESKVQVVKKKKPAKKAFGAE